MLKVAVGQSADIDLERAVAEVIAQAKADLAGARAAAGLVFMPDGIDYGRVLAPLAAAFPETPLAGCTTAGGAAPPLGFQDDAVLLLLFSSPDTGFALGVGSDAHLDPERAAAEAVRQMHEGLGGHAPRLCFLFSDAMAVKPDTVLTAMKRQLGPEVTIVGGAAAAYPPGGKTRLFFGETVLSKAVVLLAASGPLEVAAVTETSWQPVGKPGVITKAAGQKIETIDGQPALSFYRKHLGEEAALFIGAPLAVCQAGGGYHLRTPFWIDTETGAIEVIGDVAEGQRVHVAFATMEAIRSGASHIIDKALAAFPAERSPGLVFFCSCASRKMFLALDTGLEFEQMRARVGPDVPVIGFYGFGEFGAGETDGPAEFHNQSIVSVVVG